MKDINPFQRLVRSTRGNAEQNLHRQSFIRACLKLFLVKVERAIGQSESDAVNKAADDVRRTASHLAALSSSMRNDSFVSLAISNPLDDAVVNAVRDWALAHL